MSLKKDAAMLLEMTDPSYEASLIDGEPLQVQQGVYVTLSNGGSEALLEVDAAKTSEKVSVAGHEVIDVFPFELGRTIEIGERRFVIVRANTPYLTFAPEKQRRERLARILAHRPLNAVFTPASSESEQKGVPRIGPKKPKQMRRRYVWVTIGLAVVLLVGLCVGVLFETNLVEDKVDDVQDNQSDFSQAEITDHSELSKESRKNPSTLPQTDNIKTSSKIGEGEKSFKEKHAKRAVAKKPRRQTVKKNRPAKPKPDIDPTALRELERRFNEYVLEARFDPVSARSKMKKLLKRVPQGSSLYRKIRGKLSH